VDTGKAIGRGLGLAERSGASLRVRLTLPGRSVLAFHANVKSVRLSRLELQFKPHLRADNPIRRRIALDSHLTIYIIQTLIGQNYVVRAKFFVWLPASVVARRAANFENVGEIRREKNGKWN
jgi:hypothetical protein